MDARKNPRYLALAALLEVEKGGYSNLVLRGFLGDGRLNKTDRSFVSRLFYGVIERKITLDFELAPHLNRRPDLEILMLLRLAVYQICYMDGVPPHTAVDESVKLCATIKKTSAKGYVNGVLRAFLRAGRRGDMAEIEDPVRRLCVTYSCGEDLVGDLIGERGLEQTETILAAGVEAPPIFGRVNTQKNTCEGLIATLAAEEIVAEPTFLADCIRFVGGVAVERSAAFEAGLFHIQDLSSQLCAAVVTGGLARGIVLDLCAAPGGKSFSLAQNMQDKGRVYAFDIYPFKVKLVEEGANRLGLTSIRVKEGDATLFDPDLAGADRVLCDVPCSGFGIIGKKPEIKYKKRADYRSLPVLQLKILENGARYVAPGGVLIYSTCTLLQGENEKVASLFAKRHPEFVPCPLPTELAAAIHPENTNMATIFPHTFGSDGFFIATFKREELD